MSSGLNVAGRAVLRSALTYGCLLAGTAHRLLALGATLLGLLVPAIRYFVGGDFVIGDYVSIVKT